MKNYFLTFVLAALVALTGVSLRSSLAAGNSNGVPSISAIDTDPLPLPPASAIDTDPLPLPPASAIDTDPLPLPPA